MVRFNSMAMPRTPFQTGRTIPFPHIQGDLKSIVLHDMSIEHVKSSFPLALGVPLIIHTTLLNSVVFFGLMFWLTGFFYSVRSIRARDERRVCVASMILRIHTHTHITPCPHT